MKSHILLYCSTLIFFNLHGMDSKDGVIKPLQSAIENSMSLRDLKSKSCNRQYIIVYCNALPITTLKDKLKSVIPHIKKNNKTITFKPVQHIGASNKDYINILVRSNHDWDDDYKITLYDVPKNNFSFIESITTPDDHAPFIININDPADAHTLEKILSQKNFIFVGMNIEHDSSSENTQSPSSSLSSFSRNKLFWVLIIALGCYGCYKLKQRFL